MPASNQDVIHLDNPLAVAWKRPASDTSDQRAFILQEGDKKCYNLQNEAILQHYHPEDQMYLLKSDQINNFKPMQKRLIQIVR